MTNKGDNTFKFKDAGVLIVDENTGFLELTSQILLGFGFRKFERYSRLKEAANPRTNFDPDLILVDPFPDVEAGMSLIGELRRRQAESGLPAVVIVVTGHTPRPLIEQARRIGADYIVAKPFSPSTLLDRILWSASPSFASGASDDDTERAPADEVAYRASIQNAAAALLQ